MLVSILNWNGLEDTQNCLRGLDRAAAPRLKFLVLDNGSSLDPSEALGREFPDVEVLRVPSNLGFTGGHNKVMQLAMDRGFGAVALLNNDCELSIQALEALLHALDADPQAAAASSLIYRSGPEKIALMVAGSIDWLNHRSIRPSTPDWSEPPGQPTLLVGTALAFRCTALQEIGLLDDRYFAYYEDNDISARIAEKGWKAIYVKNSICLHRHKPLHHYSSKALYLITRNQWLFWKTHTKSDQKRGLWRRLAIENLENIVLLKKHNSPKEKINAILTGYRDAQRGIFGPPPEFFQESLPLKITITTAPYFLSKLLKKTLSIF